jgi:hypothetical protein
MKEANELWALICRKAGVNIPLTFTVDNSLPVGAYCVKGATITHNSTTANNAAVMAVAAIAETLFGAVMIHPGEDGIKIEKPFFEIDELAINYTPTLVRNNYVNLSASGWDRTWFHWHHIPTEGSGGAAFHQSWFQDMLTDYPHLFDNTRPWTKSSKPDITHPDFPKAVFEQFIKRGAPKVVNLFEVDGTDFHWVNNYYRAPEFLNVGEKERYQMCINQSIKPNVPVGFAVRARADGLRYQLTDKFFTALQSIPNQSKYPRQPNYRCQYTGFYLDSFIKVRNYFDAKGYTDVIYNILAYSAYRTLPPGDWDLTRFHVYYTSQNANTWTFEEMLIDSIEARKWKTTGAKLIWRPNFILRLNPDRLSHHIISAYLRRVRFDGVQLPPYKRPEWPFGNGIDIYAAFRTMQGKEYIDYLNYVPDGYMDWHNSRITDVTAGKDEDDI